MAEKRIRIEIKRDGTVRAHTLGFQGRGCESYVEVLEKILDAKATEVTKRPEYFLREELSIDAAAVETIQEYSRKN
jgi:hypothetical protein